MGYLLGLDIGTSSVKGIIMDKHGSKKSTVKVDFKYYTDGYGKVEISGEAFIDVCFFAIRTLVKSLPDGEKIDAVSTSSASGNLLITDEKGVAISPIFNWRDSRVNNEAIEILKNLDVELYYKKTGWRFDFKTFPLAMLCYIKKHSPELLKNSNKVCMSTEYLYYHLTKKWGIGTSVGTPFYLIDQERAEYVEDALNVLGIKKEWLPPILKTGTVLGCVSGQACERTGLMEGTPVVLGTFDHPGAARGEGVLNEGELLLSCGTSWVGFFPVRDREVAIKNNMLIDPFLSEQGIWGAMFSLTSVSDRIKLYTEKYVCQGNEMFSKLSELSMQSCKGANGVIIDIYNEPDDGLKQYKICDVARAIMEGTARQLLVRIEKLKKDGITFNSAVMVGGPSEDSVWRMVLEDVTGICIKAGRGSYSGATGAAIMAGIGVGIYENEQDALKQIIKES